MVNPPGSAKSFHWTKEHTVHGESAESVAGDGVARRGELVARLGQVAILQRGRDGAAVQTAGRRARAKAATSATEPGPVALKVEASK